jgi:hypothetical protein
VVLDRLSTLMDSIWHAIISEAVLVVLTTCFYVNCICAEFGCGNVKCELLSDCKKLIRRLTNL